MTSSVVDSLTSPPATLTRRRWTHALAAWAGCVVGFGLLLQLATWWTLSREHLRVVDGLVRAVQTDDPQRARMLADGLATWSSSVPFAWLELAGFALVGLTVLALARAGARWAAVALPLVFAVVPTRDLAAWQGGGLSPVPFGEMLGEPDWSTWTLLLDDSSSGVSGAARAMLSVTALQAGLLLLPLLVVPALSPRIDVFSVARRLAGPAIIVSALAVFFFGFTDVFTTVRTAAAAVTLVALSGLLSAADTSRWLRIPAAIVLPSVTVGVAFADAADVWPGRVALAVSLLLASAGVAAWMELTPSETVDSQNALELATPTT